MIREHQLVDMIDLLQAKALRRWVELGWIAPRPDDEGPCFENTDVARVHLICDLVYDLDLGEESVPVILSLLDQLHDARRMLKAVASAIDEQPAEVRQRLADHARHVLGSAD